jgi:hypothetical protein
VLAGTGVVCYKKYEVLFFMARKESNPEERIKSPEELFDENA